MGAALVGLLGVAVGATVTGAWGFTLHNQTQAEVLRQGLQSRFDLLMDAVTRLEAAVQRWHAAAVRWQRDNEARYLDDAGREAGDVSTASLAVEALAADLDTDGSLLLAARELTKAARATLTAPVPTSAWVASSAQQAYLAQRDGFVDLIGRRLAGIRQAPTTWRDWVRGRPPDFSSPPVRGESRDHAGGEE